MTGLRWAVALILLAGAMSCADDETQVASCSDGIVNSQETALDCGGNCAPCGDLSACLEPSDCQSGVCVDEECQVPSCEDLVLNGEETDVDCGGGACTTCLNSYSCLIGSDCLSGICEGGACQPVCPESMDSPRLFDGIYYDMYSRNTERRHLAEKLDQGAGTREYNEAMGNDVLPYCYGGAVDWNADRVYTDEDRASFAEWLDENVPADYTGPLVLDMEGQWWGDMEYASTQAEMDVIIDFYLEGLIYAQSLRPNIQFGYWGLPKKHTTVIDYTGPNVERLLLAQGAIFPDTYENNPGGDDYQRLSRHVADTIRIVGGRIPVYPQFSPRYKVSGMVSYCGRHDDQEIVDGQVRAILDAMWEAQDGTTCEVAGLAMWDAYVYGKNCYEGDWDLLSDKEVTLIWQDIDQWHLGLYEAFTSEVEQSAAEAGD